MNEVGFDRKRDRLFSVGDLIDRGPDSKRCLSFLDEPWFHMVRGNHEDMLINACGAGGESYNWWDNYGSWAKRIDPAEMETLAKKIQSLPVAMTIQLEGYDVGICHAEPDGKNWKTMVDNPGSENVMLWGRRVLRNKPEYDVEGVDFTVHGHTPLESPLWVGNRYFIDTGVFYSKKLVLRKLNDIFEEYSLSKKIFN